MKPLLILLHGKRILEYAVLLLLLFSIKAFAGLDTTDYNYINDLIGDRATGLGGAYCAISDDPSGAYYNPAGLVFTYENQISLSVNSYKSKKLKYKGVISGITDWGIYVELENKIEGMVPIRELDDDFYIFDERNYALVGRHSRKTYQLGDDVKVKIWRTNLERKQLDFLLDNSEKVDVFE